MAASGLTISRFAAAAGVHVETVRYYQRRGLLPDPGPASRGIRRYNDLHVARLRFIRRAQAMGFTLQEIAQLLDVRGQRACAQMRVLTERKLAEVQHRLTELRQLEGELQQWVRACSQTGTDKSCPTLNRLDEGTKGVQRPRIRSDRR